MNNISLTTLITHLQEISHWGSISALLSWDQETYMPEGAIDCRSAQTALVAKLMHERHTSAEFKAILGDLVDLKTGTPFDATLTSQEVRLLKEVYRDWSLASALPTDFVEEFSKLKSQAQHTWQHSRKNNDFASFLPYLTQLVTFTKQRAHYIGVTTSVYDTLLDEYEPGLTTADINPVFEGLKNETITLLRQIQAAPKPQVLDLTQFVWDDAKQWAFGIDILKDMGFDFTMGRQDKSTHPFSSQLHPTDVRITTRFNPHDLLDGLSSTMHEGGHALYEQGLDKDWFGTPLCSAISFGVHESQSRLWENGVGKNRAFWEHYFPKLQAQFPDYLKPTDSQTFYNSINQVQPSLIRVESDELTYNLHILIRYELELALFNGNAAPADLPKLWNQKYQDYLGVTPPTDSLGVLQDVHWSCGYFGYFPTYTIGNLYAAMLLEAIQKQLPLASQLSSGQLLPLRNWLKQNIHQVGRGQSASELMKNLTGYGLTEKPFVNYVRNKFSALYGL
jgi:carboxypeptidase Taq